MINKKMIPLLILLIIIVYLGIFIVKDIPKNRKEELSKSKVVNKNTNTQTNTVTNVNENKPVEVDTNPIETGLYYNDKDLGKRVLKEEYTASWTYHKDIISFNVFYTTEKEIANTKPAILFEQYQQDYTEDISNYRIGYEIEFNDQKILITKPSDTEQIYDTLEVYLYDAIAHKNDTWYSHIKNEEYNKNTLLQGIKLTAGQNINNITTDIKVTAFTYNMESFDGTYDKNHSYTVTIKKA